MMWLVAGLMTLMLLAGDRTVSAEVIDRIVAVISGQIITKSDVEAALALGLVDVPTAGDRMSNGLQALVDRVLMLNEVRRVVPPEPTAAAVDARLALIRARFESPAALAEVLAASGIDEKVLRIYATDDVRLATYLEERFANAAQPTNEEVRGADEAAIKKMTEERRRSFVSAWVAELRRRADVTVLP